MIFFIFSSWSCSLWRLQKVGMNRGCWILLWLMYDCQQWSREIMHVWSKTCNTHTDTQRHKSPHLIYQLVWWVASCQIVCLQNLILLLYIPSFCLSLHPLVSLHLFLLLTLPETLCRNTHTHSLTHPADAVTSLGSDSGRKPQSFHESTSQNVTV